MRAWGLKLAERMVALFADRMAMGRPILVNRPGMLVEGDRYRAEVDTFGGFDFLYELNWAGHDVVARPDGAVANLAMAVRSRAGGGPATVLSCFQGFREIRGWTPPLFRDRLIWPFVQFNDLVPAAEAGAETAALLDRMIGFFDTLALPVRIIDMGPWKNYARRLYNVVGHLGDGSPTTLAMIFIVGDAYRHHAGVPEGLEAFDAGLRRYMLSVYNYMASGVLLTGIVALLFASSGLAYQILAGPGLLKYIIMFAPLAFVMVLSFGINRLSTVTAQALYWAYAAVMGLSLSSIFLVYTSTSIAQTFFATAAAFAGLSLWGYTTKKDLSGFGTFLIMGVVGLLVASLINLFLRSSAMDLVISFLGVLLFAGLTAYDTQKIKSIYAHVAGTDMMGKSVVMGALNLYLDFINMFLFLLRFMGGSRD